MAGVDDGIDLRATVEDDELFEDDMDEDVQKVKANATKRKGRGFGGGGRAVKYDSAQASGPTAGPQRSIEGWIVLITNVHEEAQEEQVRDIFADFGGIRNLRLSLDRRTGFAKGYALVEYETYKEAEAAIKTANGQDMLGQTLGVDWAFVRGSGKKSSGRRKGGRF